MMTTQEITDAIFYLVPNAEFSFTETDLSTLEWHTADVPKPTVKAITDAIPLAQAKIAADKAAKDQQKQAVLDRLGVTADELAAALS
jgi:hypothetical protein